MKEITVIVETPKGTAQKYDFDATNNRFKLDKVLPAGMSFPYDFGFITDTKGEDGDPLDVVVISELGTFVGCCLDCRIIGAITAEQTKDKKTVRNDRFIAIPMASHVFKDVHKIKDLPKQLIEELQQFFVNYNQEEGRKFKPLGLISGSKSLALIRSQTKKTRG